MHNISHQNSAKPFVAHIIPEISKAQAVQKVIKTYVYIGTRLYTKDFYLLDNITYQKRDNRIEPGALVKEINQFWVSIQIDP